VRTVSTGNYEPVRRLLPSLLQPTVLVVGAEQIDLWTFEVCTPFSRDLLALVPEFTCPYSRITYAEQIITGCARGAARRWFGTSGS
jgi:hypothetical protein